MSHNQLTIRSTIPSDLAALSCLTTVGSRQYLSGRGLVAEVDGDAIAAISRSWMTTATSASSGGSRT